MDIRIVPGSLQGKIDAVPSKSVLHRALICSALAAGQSKITNVVLSEDIKATALALKSLGAGISFRDNTIIVEGIDVKDPCLQVEKVSRGPIEIDCGESGSTLRFMIPVASALGIEAVFSGEGRLPERPLKTYFTELGKKGIGFDHPEEKNLPLLIKGRLRSGHYKIPGSVSSQYITGLLLALPICDGDSVISVEEPFESKGYVDITVSIMEEFGIFVEEQNGTYKIKGNQTYQNRCIDIEGDWSQAAAWLCAGAINGDITVYGLDPDSKQGDAAVLDILRRFGAKIDLLEDGGVRASKGVLKGIGIDAAQIPDIVPVLSAAAALAKGRTEIINAGRLRFKESDRLESTAMALTALGADIRVDCDSLIIDGKDRLQGGTASSHNDHRIVMALATAACGCYDAVTIGGYGCISKSYPHFFDDYRKLGGKADGIDLW